MKRYIYIIVGIVVVAVAAILLILFLKQPTAPATQTGTTGTLPQPGQTSGNTGGTGSAAGNGGSSSTGGALPSGGAGDTSAGPGVATSFGIVAQGPVSNYFVDSQNNIIVVGPDGKISEITAGQSTDLSTTGVADLLSSDFSYDGTKILINFGDPINPQSSIFDIASKAWTPLSQGLVSPHWSLSDYRIAYFKAAPTGTTAIATIDTANLKKAPLVFATMNAQDLLLQWLNKTQLLISDKPGSLTVGSVWRYDLSKKTLASIVNSVTGLETIWSPATTSTAQLGLAFSSGAGGRGGALTLKSATGTTVQNLNIVTLPSKCAFNIEPEATSTPSSSTVILYCGVPRDQSTFGFSQLPDDYMMQSLHTADNIYRIDMTTGNIQTPWADASQSIDATMLKYFNNRLFFINRYDQKLYALSFSTSG